MTPKKSNACRYLLHRMVTLVGALFVLFSNPVYSQAKGHPITVACASALRFVMPELIDLWHRQTELPVRVVYGSSGNLYRQILQGAPFDLFLAANEGYVLRLHQEGMTIDDGLVYATGRLALMQPKTSPVKLSNLNELALAVQTGQVKTVAIATPVHAPYGQGAQEAIESAGLSHLLNPLLVFGESVSQAGQFVLSGAADVGVVAQSLARAPALKDRMRFALLPTSLHQPLRQRMVRLHTAQRANRREQVDQLYRFLKSETAQKVMQRHGFE